VLIGRASFVRLCRARELLAAAPDDGEDGSGGRSVHAIAAQLGMSAGQLIRQFRALFGQTPHQLRIDARLARARQLLVLGHPVTEVCMAVGCSSLGSFSSAFLRRVGASPSAFQRSRRSVQVPGQVPVQVPVQIPTHDCFAGLALLSAPGPR
jgi:AraC-like DNA-binding protein